MQDKLSQTISWKPLHRHESNIGANWDMLNDHLRNQFYNELLKQCKDKVVIDVGFGTGILSIIALKHGAKIIHAYEMDKETYLLGKHIIKRLGLKSKIILKDKMFVKEFDDLPDAIIIHEIVGRNIWNESLTCLNNVSDPRKVIPSVFHAKLYAMEKTEVEVDFKSFHPDTMVFDPGIDLGKYNNVIQELIDDHKTSRIEKFQHYYEFPYIQVPEGYGGHGDYEEVGSYTYDINTQKIPENIIVDLDIYGKDIVIWPQYYMDDYKLNTPSWKADKGCLCNDLQQGSTFIQNTGSGKWWIKCT